MNRLLFIAFFIFLNACSFNIDSKYWNEKSDKKNDNKKLTEIIKKSNDIRLMTIEEYEIYINNYIKKSKFPDIN
ncbi:hypothetical protein N9U71_02070 [Candidatus Pelagibacter sp.]|nr:hypothetical protein [Candidatus Pelagibacter sp.]